jgi:hypothetical protein
MRGRPSDPYAVLGLAPGATAADIQRAYRRRARLVHPDIAGPGATSSMAELNLARDDLLKRLPPGGEPVRPTVDPASRPPSPGWASDHEAAWDDYWSAWSKVPHRDEPPR